MSPYIRKLLGAVQWWRVCLVCGKALDSVSWARKGKKRKGLYRASFLFTGKEQGLNLHGQRILIRRRAAAHMMHGSTVTYNTVCSKTAEGRRSFSRHQSRTWSMATISACRVAFKERCLYWLLASYNWYFTNMQTNI